MKISNHTIIVENYPAQNEHLLYSTRTQALVKINQELKDVLARIDAEYSWESSEHSKDLAHLHRMGIIVKDEQEEQEKLKAHLKQVKFSYDQSCFTVSILTTYACNFKCTYCFEESSRTNVKLDFSTQEHVIRWLKKKMGEFGYRRLHINYYGGEPLLNPAAIEYISSEMLSWCESNSIVFDMSIQTNGYLLTPQLVEQFKKLRLKAVRISLDGVGEDHDRSRPLRGGGGTFDRIIKNISDCADLIPIGISIGFSDGNVEPIERLLNYLEDRGILHKLGKFIFSPINPTLGPKGEPTAIRGSDCMCNSEDAMFASAVRKINAILDKRGVNTPKSGMATSTCPLTRENGGVTIDQEGRLYKCNSLLGHPEFSVGSVYTDELNEKGKEFRDLDVWKQCPTDCTYLPMCSGGCRLMSFVGGNKNFKVPSCKKPYLNEMAPEFVKRDYDRMVKQSRDGKTSRELVHG